jgi:hypothetical protein
VSTFAMLIALLARGAAADQLLADPGFEDPRPLLPEDSLLSDPWRQTFFTLAPTATNAIVMPKSGLQHALLTADASIAGITQIDTSAFAGFGPAAGIADFRGRELGVAVDYKFAENTIMGAAGDPGTWVRILLAYFGSSNFLGFGTTTDIFHSDTQSDYLHHSYVDTVPNFGMPVTSISFNLSVLGRGQGSTGRATVYFDDASLIVVPEPTTLALLGLAVCPLVFTRRRR